MTYKRVVACASSGLVTLLLAACGGGGSGGDISPSAPPVATASGSDTFLLFPNPQALPDGSSPKIDSSAYALAYYAAVDPANAKDTLAKWKAANGFDTGTGTQVSAVFADVRDLGYGRRMTARKNLDGTIAFLVENYLANPGNAYALAPFSPVSLEAAVVQDTRWLILINAIEFSPGPQGGASFAKFFNFDPVTGRRQLTVDLDRRGEKAMPGACITCHGGRGDALTPDATGRLVFNVVQNSASGAPGDVQARLAPLELGIPSEVGTGTSLKVGALQFSTRAGYTRSEQEAALKTMNTFVLCSYPLPTGATPQGPEDSCRREANNGEWQGTAADLIKQAYGGDRLPSDTYTLAQTYMPPEGWPSNQTALYQDVVAPSCRACHILRGTGAQSDIDLTTFDKFKGFAIFPGDGYPKAEGFDDRIKAHAIDRGNMPLAKIVYDTFWSSTNPGPSTMATFLQGQGFTVRDAAGAVLQPGRPIADPGPDRVVGRTQGPISLSTAGSLFANAYSWSIDSGPDGATPPTGATLTNPTSASPTFSATTNGKYVLRLVVSNGSRQSEAARLTLVVQTTLSPAATAIGFGNITSVLQSANCIGCHNPNGAPPPPVFFADQNGALRTDAAFYAELRSRINFTDIVASPLLRKPAGNHHGGGLSNGFDATALPGDPARANYDLFLNWILNRAPQ